MMRFIIQVADSRSEVRILKDFSENSLPVIFAILLQTHDPRLGY